MQVGEAVLLLFSILCFDQVRKPYPLSLWRKVVWTFKWQRCLPKHVEVVIVSPCSAWCTRFSPEHSRTPGCCPEWRTLHVQVIPSSVQENVPSGARQSSWERPHQFTLSKFYILSSSFLSSHPWNKTHLNIKSRGVMKSWHFVGDFKDPSNTAPNLLSSCMTNPVRIPSTNAAAKQPSGTTLRRYPWVSPPPQDTLHMTFAWLPQSWKVG